MHLKFTPLSFSLLCLGLFLLGAFGAIASWPLMDHALRDRLVSMDKPAENATFDAVYIFGGNQAALEPKFDIVSDLYARNRTDTVLILSRKGTTEYNPAYGRNLTNDEWSLINLKRRGVPQEDVQTVETDGGFFGTFAETRRVSELAREREYEAMALVSSPHHTRRIRECLAHSAKSGNFTYSVLGSDYRCSPLELFREYLKLQLYRLVLF
jgi:hypothetical protein